MGTCASTGARTIITFPEQEVRVLIIGQKGNGKSSLGNTLLRREVFGVDSGMVATTKECMWESGSIDGINLSVTDTPGFSKLSKEEFIKELSKSFVLSCPGPHVVIIVLRCDRPFTEEEHATVMTLLDLLVDKDRRFLMIVFAGGDSLPTSEDGMQLALQKKLMMAPEHLSEVLREVGSSYCAVDNTGSCKDEKRRNQARIVFSMIQTLIQRNNRESFTNSRWEEYNKILQAEVKRVQETENLSKTEAETKVRSTVTQGSFWNRMGETIQRIGTEYIGPSLLAAAARGASSLLGQKFSSQESK